MTDEENKGKQEKINNALSEYRKGKISLDDYIKVIKDNLQNTKMESEKKEKEYSKTVLRIARPEYKAKGEIIKGYTEDEVYKIINEHLKKFLDKNDINTDIIDFQIIGSRNKGTASIDSDLDVLIEYNNDNFSEDSLYNLLNDEKNELIINGVEVEINPITFAKSGTIDEWLDRNYNYNKYQKELEDEEEL